MNTQNQSKSSNSCQCRYCKAPLADRATVCQTCQRPQSVFLNRLGPIGTAIGIMTFALASLTYTGSKFSDAFLSSASMRLVKVTDGEPVVVNTGDYAILLEHWVADIPAIDHKVRHSIDRVVSPGADNQAQRIVSNGPTTVSSFRTAYTFLSLTKEQKNQLSESTSLDFHLLILSATSEEAKTILADHPEATSFNGTVTLTARSWETGDTLSETVDVIVSEFSIPPNNKYKLVNPPSYNGV